MTKTRSILNEIIAANPDAIILKGYDDCIIGLCNTFDGVRALYSEYKIINQLGMQGMAAKDTMIYYENEILGKYHGAYSPIFLIDLDQY